MKVLIVAPYLYCSKLTGFRKNRTGFGILLDQFTEYIGERCELYFFSNVITKELYHNNAIIIRHTWWDIFSSLSITDLLAGVKVALIRKQSIRNRLLYIYYRINCGILRKSLLQIRPDVVHCQGVGEKYLYYIKTCVSLGVPVVNTLHGLIGLSDSIKVSKEDKASELEYLQYAEKLHIQTSVISTGILRRIEKSYPQLDHSFITIIPNGTRVDTQFIKKDIRLEYNISQNNKIIISVGSVCINKNQSQIVRSISLLPFEIRKKITVLLLGTITDGYKIEDEIKSLGLEDQIICCGFIDQSLIGSFYSCADLNILASIDEGFGLSMIEGFVYGVPCVSFSDLDAIPDIYDECAMLLCDERSDDFFSQTIMTALETQWEKKLIQEHSKKFSLDNMANRYVEFYQKALTIYENQ